MLWCIGTTQEVTAKHAEGLSRSVARPVVLYKWAADWAGHYGTWGEPVASGSRVAARAATGVFALGWSSQRQDGTASSALRALVIFLHR